MKRIFKYELPVDGGKISIKTHIIEWLKVSEQNGQPYIWAIVDEEKEPFEYEIVSIGTGWAFPDELTAYLGTTEDGYGFVWHYFILSINKEWPEIKN